MECKWLACPLKLYVVIVPWAGGCDTYGIRGLSIHYTSTPHMQIAAGCQTNPCGCHNPKFGCAVWANPMVQPWGSLGIAQGHLAQPGTWSTRKGEVHRHFSFPSHKPPQEKDGDGASGSPEQYGLKGHRGVRKVTHDKPNKPFGQQS